MHRRKLFGLAACLPLAGVSGCITTQLHQERGYSERLQGVLMSADKQSLVVVGGQYHYVFAAPAQVVAALDPALHPAIEAAGFQGFRVGIDQRIQGTLFLRLKRDASPAQLQAARQAGFLDRGGQMMVEVGMYGERYAVRNDAPLPLQKLNREYYVRIAEEDLPGAKIAKAVMTPVTLAADGVLLLGAVVLMPLWLPFMIASQCCGRP